MAARSIFVSAFPLLPLSLVAIAVAVMPARIADRAPSAHAIRDTSGRLVDVPLPAHRIVMFPPVLWEYLAVQTDARRLAALTDSIADIARKSLLGRVYPDVLDKPSVVTRGARTAAPGDPEDVMRHHPDAVLSWDWLSENLTAVGLPVVHLALNAKNRSKEVHANDIANLRVMAALTGRGERAEDIIRTYHVTLAEVTAKARAAKTAEGRAPRALFLSVRNGRQLYLEAPPFTQGIALAVAGADIAEFRPSGTIDAEQLLLWDPDVILLNCCYGENVGPDYFYDDPAFRGLTAVRERRIYKAPSGAARMEGILEWPYLIAWLVEVLYPHNTTHTVRSDVARSYEHIFGYRVSATELDQMFAVDANRRSRDYALIGRRGL